MCQHVDSSHTLKTTCTGLPNGLTPPYMEAFESSWRCLLGEVAHAAKGLQVWHRWFFFLPSLLPRNSCLAFKISLYSL